MVERDLPKVDVEGSSPFTRSSYFIFSVALARSIAG